MTPKTLPTSFEDLAEQHEQRVERAGAILERIVVEPVSLSEAIHEAGTELDISESTVREAITRLLYSGVLQLTDDRRLAPGDRD